MPFAARRLVACDNVGGDVPRPLRIPGEQEAPRALEVEFIVRLRRFEECDGVPRVAAEPPGPSRGGLRPGGQRLGLPEQPIGFGVVALTVEGLRRDQAGGEPLGFVDGQRQRRTRVFDGLRVQAAGDFDAGGRGEIRRGRLAGREDRRVDFTRRRRVAVGLERRRDRAQQPEPVGGRVVGEHPRVLDQAAVEDGFGRLAEQLAELALGDLDGERLEPQVVAVPGGEPVGDELLDGRVELRGAGGAERRPGHLRRKRRRCEHRAQPQQVAGQRAELAQQVPDGFGRRVRLGPGDRAGHGRGGVQGHRVAVAAGGEPQHRFALGVVRERPDRRDQPQAFVRGEAGQVHRLRGPG